MKVTLIEDDIVLGKELVMMLERNHYQVKWFKKALDLNVQDHQADIYLVDVMLPDISGFDLCAKIRSYTQTPIIILTALDDEKSIIYGFQKGANDYVIKPFSFQVLNMRIKSLLRLTQKIYKQYMYCDELKIDMQNHQIYKNNEPVKLRKVEFEILKVLVQNVGKICTRDYLLDHLYRYEDIEEATLTVHISRLRKSIGKSYIETVYGFGYRWSKEFDNYV